MISALLIQSPWIDKILAGTKTWETTHKCGRIALIQSKSGTAVGVAEIVDVFGPLILADLNANARNIGVEKVSRKPYKRTFAWVLKGATRLRKRSDTNTHLAVSSG